MKQAIIAGSIAGLIVWLITSLLLKPFLDFLGSHLVSMGSGLISLVVDPIYREAARGDIDVAGHFVARAVGGGVAGFAGGLITALAQGAIRRRRPRNLAAIEQQAGAPSFGIFSKTILAIVAVSALPLTYYAIRDEMAMNLNASFRQRLTILSPFLTNREERQLRAAWASMRDRKDFDKLKKQLDESARQYGIVFPPPLPGY